MPKNLLTDAKKEELRALLMTGEAWRVQQLVQIDFPGFNAYEVLKERVQERRDNPKFWVHLEYKEKRELSWRGFLGRCKCCRSLLPFNFHETFSCGHLSCPHEDANYCFLCGPSFDQLWEFLKHEKHQPSKVEWPEIPEKIFNATQIENFATSVVQAHKTAVQQIHIEALVSFSLHRSSAGVTWFLESHRDLVDMVKKSRNSTPLELAWNAVHSAAKEFEFLRKALETGLRGKSEQSDNLKTVEGFLYTIASPIGNMFEVYSLPEFSERIPLLSRKITRTGILTTDFTVYDEIKESDKEQDEWKRGCEVVQTWKAKLSSDISDICLVYPHFGATFLELSKDLKLHGDILSCATIIMGLKDYLGSDRTRLYLESLSTEEE
ncbi:uncharacterized protein LTHEOB_13002 [Lasiodiplodia theobromae]|uniref:uncharacterized protein n=1 Tax=Lasiodiplodia theobromae TaxID=45133 RepID=UPI0015C34456|nr:uncharacterized protein LTHEOB_13002 [Lasiodiplodia theobromae]KAF4534187.1 hypothetical protein LTHEOB_13002 [Lasiodiplodia theobromae]